MIFPHNRAALRHSRDRLPRRTRVRALGCLKGGVWLEPERVALHSAQAGVIFYNVGKQRLQGIWERYVFKCVKL